MEQSYYLLVVPEPAALKILPCPRRPHKPALTHSASKPLTPENCEVVHFASSTNYVLYMSRKIAPGEIKRAAKVLRNIIEAKQVFSFHSPFRCLQGVQKIG